MHRRQRYSFSAFSSLRQTPLPQKDSQRGRQFFFEFAYIHH
ncbi:hypothetical protein CAter282_0927 [Collimonas arenae]|uniref:Uncharacterized protein n=1 Tax=Collimonas arenae TaxID=279058 RepID=A0A127QF91_9BURK|nr:hypothetical protein CAter10_1002 [Collimonas arenae]AMP08727.1 hypothetical protein CAter282_0927 [Collimonas arenae]